MRGNQSLHHIFAALREFGGYFVLEDEEGNEYIIQSSEVVSETANEDESRDIQLTFASFAPQESESEPMEGEPEEVSESDKEDDLDLINQTIAVFGLDDHDHQITEESEVPPPRRVRFEPIRGDLPPELQE